MEIMKNLATALAKAQSEFRTVPQSGKNPFHKSTYSTLKDCWDTARPVLANHGLSVLQFPDIMGDGNFVLKTVVLHESGESMEGYQPVISSKPDAQSMGSALTYARRYGLCAALGLVSGDEDDDGNAASQVKSKPAKAKTAPPATPPSVGGATNPSLTEQIKSAPHLGALTTLYEGNKDAIGAMSEDERNKVLEIFKAMKVQLSGKEKI
jgi:hypothetical protein